jgi:hypothetical protein
MARKKAKAKAKNNDPIVLDGMPGADPIPEEDKEGFQVDLNFSEEEPKEEVPNEEDDSNELETTPEEMEAKAEEQGEEEGSEGGEEPSEEVVAEGDEQSPQQDVQPAPEEPTEVEKVEEVEAKPTDKAPMVPKSRLDEVLAKSKALQKQLNDIQQANQVAQKEAPKYDFDKKEAEYQELVLNGESQKATELRKEIREAEKSQYMFEVEQKMGQNIQQNQEMMDLQEKALQINETFPILDENSAVFDEPLQNEVISLRDAFMQQGFVPVDALTKAVEYTLAAKKPELLSTEDKKPTQETKAVQEKQQKAKVSQKLEAAESQPPQMKGQSAGNKPSATVDVNKLTEKEFNALPAETLRRMRGDFG